LLGHARAIVERVAVAETSLKAFAASLAEPPRLRLAIISSIAASLTPVLLNEFAQTFPGVQLRITEAATVESRELVDKGTVDVAISLALLGKATQIARERLYLVANALGGQPRGDLTFAALTETPLVLPARENPLRELLEREAARLDRSLNVVLEIDGPSSRTNAISSGRWCTVLGATSAIKLAQTPGFVVRRIVEPELRRPLYLCAREGLPPAFVDRLRLALINALGNLNSLDFAA
jgi:DNA-binding transcriptional LysR family regulator